MNRSLLLSVLIMLLLACICSPGCISVPSHKGSTAESAPPEITSPTVPVPVTTVFGSTGVSRGPEDTNSRRAPA